ncbi:MAG TPA: SDR family NAD(P)-dependent oxidoreductase [Planococcus sp. (in: firmicutes)]|nr:SDR family NAD(P)-dependent oxidoreductase [Planococcus sp. (in: firmicutes)]
MEAFIVTGASKGIGSALCHQLHEQGKLVIGISRSVPENWQGTTLLPYDLSQSEGIPELMEQAIALIPEQYDSVTLINNAGTIEPIGLVENNDPQKIISSIGLNLTAPMLLSTAFIQQLKGFNGEKRIINISSGAGRKAYKGWSSYCAGKAGLDHFTVCLDEENDGVKAVSVAPGIIDTGMQERIRESDEEDFPLLDQFKEFKASGMLSSPEETASKLIQLINRQDFQSLQPILDLRSFE